MIGLDTNVIVRYLAQDDPRQSMRASQVFDSLTAERPGWIGLVALVETIWVLQDLYDVRKAGIARIVEQLLSSREIRLEARETVRLALAQFVEGKAEFADCLIACSAKDCESVLTFDRRAARLPGMTLLTT